MLALLQLFALRTNAKPSILVCYYLCCLSCVKCQALLTSDKYVKEGIHWSYKIIPGMIM